MSILAAHNDDAAPVDWADVVEANEPALRRLIARRMANRELVDDALQETYLRAVRSCHVGREMPDGQWLRTVARRASTDLYRGEPPPMADFDALVVAADVMLPGSDEHLDNVERRQALRWSLARLSPRHRRLLALRGVHDLSYQQIGAIENLSEEAVTAALNRARTRLRTHLYAYENRGSGAAAGLWLSDRLRRLRWRLQSMGPRMVEWAGAACTAGVMAAMVVPVHAPAQNSPAVAVGLSWTNATFITDAGETALPMGHRTGSGPAVLSPNAGPTGSDPLSERPLLAGHPDVHVGPGEATFRFTLEVNDPLGGGSTDVHFEYECGRGHVSRAVCPVLESLPPS